MTTLTATPGFGLANLPYGVYSTSPDGERRVAVRYGDNVVDLATLLGDDVFAQPTLNAFMAQGRERWVAVRQEITAKLGGDVPDDAVHALADVTLHLPYTPVDYVDFYASEYHASNLGRLFRPQNPDPLPDNWKYLPIGYHGRASSIVVSGTDIQRPCGQRKGKDDPEPLFGPSIRLDIEAEMGFVVGTASPMGGAIGVEEAEDAIFGVFLFNDWSARDIQAWEYQPLGPNLGKSFASTVSPWVVPMIALAGAKVDTPTQDPEPLPYLKMAQPWTLDISLEVVWNGEVVTRPPYSAMYWSPAQMLAHETVNGAPANVGDVFASGTISGPDKGQRGAFIELTWGGQEPVQVAGQERTFLEDGDTVTLRGTAPGANGERIDFGECTGTILPAKC